MKKNRKESFKKLMDNRIIDGPMLFGDGAPTEVIIERLNGLKGMKKYYYTLNFIIENTTENKEMFVQEFDSVMLDWILDKVSSTILEKRATDILTNHVNIVRTATAMGPVDANLLDSMFKDFSNPPVE